MSSVSIVNPIYLLNEQSLIMKVTTFFCFHSYQTGHNWQCFGELVGLKTYSSFFKNTVFKTENNSVE